MDKSETKTVYAYDNAGLLIGAHTLDSTDRSPVSGRWQIPGNCTETAPLATKDGYDIYWKNSAWEYVKQIRDVFCYYNHGAEFRTVKDTYVVTTGEVIFSTTPTTAELESSFPSTAGSRAYTIDTNAVAGDTLTILGQILTFGTIVPVGNTIESTVANIATYLNSLKVITGNYKIVASGSSLVVSEAFAGGGIGIPDATTTGTLKVTSGTATESVWGYMTQLKHEQKVALETSAETIRETYRKNYIGAMAKGDTTGAKAVLDSITALNDNLYKAMEAINNG